LAIPFISFRLGKVREQSSYTGAAEVGGNPVPESKVDPPSLQMLQAFRAAELVF
jgi:hypothetical protein